VKGRKLWISPLIALTLLAAGSGSAGADIGFTGASRTAASPGDTVRVTIGCGFCLPRCVGRPGHRHPPGRVDGTCILGGPRARPPAGFPVWLTPLGRSLGPYPPASCKPGQRCPPAQRPPRLPSFTYLGRAERTLGDDRVDEPLYVLRFQVPEVAPGRYKYVLYCDSCVGGPLGVRIESAVFAAGSLGSGVLTVRAEERAGGEAGRWIAAGIAAAVVLPGLGLWLRRRPRP
jgi:hypothetical protein